MSRRSGLLAVLSGLVLVGLVCALAWLGLASGQALAGTSTGAVTNAPTGPPDLTGYWRNKYDTSSPPWRLVASNGLQTLDATWTGGPGHTGLHGSSQGSLALVGGVYDYTGPFVVTEAGTTVNGTMTFTIVTANQIGIDIYANGKLPQFYTFVRVGGSAEAVPQPAPGATEAIQSPQDLSANADTASVDVSSSSGDLSGDAVAAQGDVATDKQLSRALGDLVAWCWLTVDFHDANGNVIDVSPALQLKACTVLIRSLVFGGKPYAATVGSPNPFALQSDPAVLSSAAGRGCRELAIPIDIRTRKGRILTIGKAKHAKLTASSVRYTCSASGGTVKITIKAHKSLRKALGKRLHPVVVRAGQAPPASGNLTFTFGR